MQIRDELEPRTAHAERAARGRALIPPWADALTRLLDHAFVIPGTRIPIGLDVILGFVAPGAGDAVSAMASGALLWLGFRLRVPRVILLRMLLNVLVDALVGAIPLLGDLFDVFFRATERNLALLRKHALEQRAPATAGDYIVLGFALVCMAALIALPVVLGLAVIHFFLRWGDG